MSSVLVADVYRAERTERIRALPTEAFRPRIAEPVVPAWCEHVENAIEAIGRVGFGPTPSILVVSAIAIAVSFRIS
jgi:hypothetical protein